MTVAIIGGGAAGMTAAIAAARGGARVLLLERGARLGRKLAVTGNGRCNLTNEAAAPERYHGEDPAFVRPALAALDAAATRRFFRGLGLVTVAEPSGRVYPHSDQAGSVVDVLRFAVAESGVEVRTAFEVQQVRREAGGFAVISAGETLRCDRLIVACGGAAGTRAGGTKAGYALLQSLGHSCTALYPSLVQLKTDNAFTRPLKGVRADAAVTVLADGRPVAESAGEVQFTDYGVSGPAVFDVSRAAATAAGPVTLRLDLMRELTAEELVDIMTERTAGGRTLEDLLTGVLHNRLGRTVIAACGYKLTAPAGSLRAEDIRRIAGAVKRRELTVTGTMGMDGAQVTAGGIRTAEFDAATMESRLVPGLYAAGEVLDIDGDCGGFNLQWAWSSGYAAGSAAAKE